MSVQNKGFETAFWREQLSGLPILDLLLDHPRRALPSYGYGRVRFQIPDDVAREFEQLAREEGATLSSFYLASYAVLLSRYGNSQEVLIGFPSGAMLRVNCPPESTFAKLRGNLSERVSAISQHSVVPPNRLAQLLNVPVAPGRAPLCDAYFDWDPNETERRSDSVCDLILEIRERANGLAGSFHYRRDLFDSSSIERMSRHFVCLLQSIVRHPETPISDLTMMPDDERALIVNSYAGSSETYPWRTLHELFAEQASLRPDAEALVFGAERLTYRELDLRSNQIAQYLRKLGIQHEDRVGIFMDRSMGMIVSMLGILKAGGAYVPIDPDYPAERLKFIAEDTQMLCILTESTVHKTFPASAPFVCLDGSESPIRASSHEPVPNISTPESIAVAIYTSGSTGKPKAACIPHRGAVRTVRNTNIAHATAEDRITQIASPSFDAAILEIWLALTNGGTLIGVRKEVLLDPDAFRKILREERITIVFLNTTHLHQIGRTAPEVLKGIHTVMFGGEAAEPGPIRSLLRHVPPGVLVNLYGPAENSVVSSCYHIRSVPDDCVSISIGRPNTNASMYVLDQQLRLVPIGLQGELYVGGDGVARGYWNRPELTAQRFIPDPFSSKPGATLYRTGDLGRLRDNGEFEFLGRIDDQIKIRGHRIEVAEVREAIASHGAVKQVFLLAREDEPGDRRLVAYVTLRQPLESPSESLRLHVKGILPAQMIPAAFVVLDSFPVNTNGKVDRKALPPPSSRPDMANDYHAPQTGLERMLAKSWEELLGVDRVGVNDNFFDLGGHSLLAARLIARIEKDTGQNIPVATLFEAPTIAQLAQKLIDHTYSRAWAPLVELHAAIGAPSAAPFFCIHSLGANLVSFHKLARLLRPDRAIYGLQPHGLDGKQRPLETVDEMGAAYLQEIRNKQPHGPYYISGICLGGVVAYDVARRLEAAGEEVRVLALIDSFVPGELEYLHDRPSIVDYLDFHLGKILLLTGTARLKYIARRFASPAIRLAWALGFRPHDSVARATRHVEESNRKAVFSYSPKPYGGKITHFMCSDWPQRSYEDRRLAWSSLAAGGLEVHIVPGTHLTMVEEPHVQTLARAIQACLDRADHSTPQIAPADDRPDWREDSVSKESRTIVLKERAGSFSSMLPASNGTAFESRR